MCHISCSLSVAVALETQKSAVACKSPRSAGVFFLTGAGGGACCAWWEIYVGVGAICTSVDLGTI